MGKETAILWSWFIARRLQRSFGLAKNPNGIKSNLRETRMSYKPNLEPLL